MLIRSRLCIYLPFIEPLKSIHDHPVAVDLGCGRGEWLELLADNGFEAQGVDIDEGMLAACYENGLRVTKEDAIAYLKKLPNESRSIVSGFHIAEHLPFSRLQMLVAEALRVLKPAGLLILETPNPENIKVSSLRFYVDPTHRNPLPPELLSFLPEYYGFHRIKVIRLQESRDLLASQAASLRQVLDGASPDYAVIAQKAADGAVARLFDSEFEKNFGLADHVLIGSFDRQLLAQNERAAALEARVNEERSTRAALEARVDQDRNARAALEARLDEDRNARANVLARVEALASRQAELWRVTRPMRFVSRAARGFRRGSRGFRRGCWAWITLSPDSLPRRIAQKLVRMVIFILGRPFLRTVWLKPSSPTEEGWEPPSPVEEGLDSSSPAEEECRMFFSERERQVHARLKAALEKRAD